MVPFGHPTPRTPLDGVTQEGEPVNQSPSIDACISYLGIFPTSSKAGSHIHLPCQVLSWIQIPVMWIMLLRSTADIPTLTNQNRKFVRTL